jgi:tryptophan synthase alpha chain
LTENLEAMNRIDQLFNQKKKDILSIYFTAGHPELNATVDILAELQASGADMVEIGMPFSDPLADGPIIQNSDQIALKNGMSVKLLFEQLKNVREKISVPLLLMGSLNPVMQYGIENFCKKCREVEIDGVILPDLPLPEYTEQYQKMFEDNGLRFIFLITPQTPEERIRQIDKIGKGFIYMVSSSSTTGVKGSIADEQLKYFGRIRSMNLNNPLMIGFGISNHDAFAKACSYANGAIVGSAFVKMLNDINDWKAGIGEFVRDMRQ